MRTFAVFFLLVGTSGCATSITGWKGRAFGDHDLLPNKVYVATGDRRFAFSFPGGRVCVEPQPELSVAFGGKSGVTLSPAAGQSGSFADELTSTAQVTTTRTEKSDLLQHQLFALCLAAGNRDLPVDPVAIATTTFLPAQQPSSQTGKLPGSQTVSDAILRLSDAVADAMAVPRPAPAPAPDSDAVKMAKMNDRRAEVGLEPLKELPKTMKK